MAESQIEWTDATWNPVAGCSVMSSGCTNCYAMQMARRLEAMGIEKYAGLTRISGRRTVWNGVVRQDYDSLRIPYTWKRPRKIFVNSMSDLFHTDVDEDFIREVWTVMQETPHHRYQILTKRPERMKEIVTTLNTEPLPNVWLGTSIENKDVIDRLDHLRQVPAQIRFVSFEPLIGPIGLTDFSDIHWAIVGEKVDIMHDPLKKSGLMKFMIFAGFIIRRFFSSSGERGGKIIKNDLKKQMAGNIEDKYGMKCH